MRLLVVLDRLSVMDKPRRYLTPEEQIQQLEDELQRGRDAFMVNAPLDESVNYTAAFLDGYDEARADYLANVPKQQ
jgi:hypothetical protein